MSAASSHLVALPVTVSMFVIWVAIGMASSVTAKPAGSAPAAFVTLRRFVSVETIPMPLLAETEI